VPVLGHKRRIGPVVFELRRDPTTDGEQLIAEAYRTTRWHVQIVLWRSL